MAKPVLVEFSKRAVIVGLLAKAVLVDLSERAAIEDFAKWS